MGYPRRIESPGITSFVTTRARCSELWFVNNGALEAATLGNLAVCVERYAVPIYAFAIEGNHPHILADFPGCNRAGFARDFNSTTAKAVARLVPTYPGGRLWGRRYSQEFVPGGEDVEEKFFYTVLQPVQDGLVERISDYPGYNCFSDAVRGITRAHQIIDWTRYNAAKKRNPRVNIRDYRRTVLLRYTRLPGYEHLSQEEYSKVMHKKLAARQAELVAKRYASGKGFMGPTKLRAVVPGSRPVSTKTSTINDPRPRALAVCPIRQKQTLEWYYDKQERYKVASARYRAGDLTVEFPEGMYRPYVPTPPPRSGPDFLVALD
jgi:hypothetical protein